MNSVVPALVKPEELVTTRELVAVPRKLVDLVTKVSWDERISTAQRLVDKMTKSPTTPLVTKVKKLVLVVNLDDQITVKPRF